MFLHLKKKTAFFVFFHTDVDDSQVQSRRTCCCMIKTALYFFEMGGGAGSQIMIACLIYWICLVPLVVSDGRLVIVNWELTGRWSWEGRLLTPWWTAFWESHSPGPPLSTSALSLSSSHFYHDWFLSHLHTSPVSIFIGCAGICVWTNCELTYINWWSIKY